MPTEDTQPTTSLEAWIAEILDTPWHRDALAPAVARLEDALRARFGLAATIDLSFGHDAQRTDGPGPDDAPDAGTLTLPFAEEAVARIDLGRAGDAATSLRPDLERAVALAGRILLDAQERWIAGVVDEIWTLLADPADPPDALPEALEVLRSATAVDLIGLTEFHGGVFVPFAIAGDPDGIPIEGAIAGPLDPDTPSGRAYFEGTARYLPERPPASAHPGRPRVAAAAVLPVPRTPYAQLQLVAGHAQPRTWRHVDRALLQGAGRVLRLYRDRQRRSELLTRVVELERALLTRSEGDAMQLILDTLVDVVPGAEAGTILVREGTTFRYDGIRGYDREGLSRVTFSLDDVRRWYEDNRPAGTAARLLRSSDGVAAASDRASGSKVGAAGRLPRIVANVTMPIEYRKSWGALVNLDAFATEHAFQDEDRRLLEAFAPIIGLVLYEADIRRELRRFATYDELTGLPNRRAFDETFRQEMRRAERGSAPLSVVVLDLDNFKRLNDAFGHEAGDRGLRTVARALRSTARQSDHVFRWGGDEFALLLPDSDRAGAERMVSRLIKAVAEVDTPGPRLGASAGVAVHVPGDGADEDDLLRRADREMYAAKRRSGG